MSERQAKGAETVGAGQAVTGFILAGGKARRMGGGDKCRRMLAGRSLLAHTIDRAGPQVDGLVINANGDLSRFSDIGLPVVADVVGGSIGPLAGILTAMEWVLDHRPGHLLLTVPTDAPFLPCDLVQRLQSTLVTQDRDIAMAGSGGWRHPVIGLWRPELAMQLRDAIQTENMRKIMQWAERYRVATVEWPDQPLDPFFNTNKPEDLETAEALFKASRQAETASGTA